MPPSRGPTCAASARSTTVGPRYCARRRRKARLSARALDRIARVARTIADLAGARAIGAEHIAEPIGYRSLERRGLAA
jgi:magnesium chelatase family protein